MNPIIKKLDELRKAGWQSITMEGDADSDPPQVRFTDSTGQRSIVVVTEHHDVFWRMFREAGEHLRTL